MSDLIIHATLLIVVYCFGVVMGFLALFEYMEDRYERKARNATRDEMPEVVQGTARGRMARTRQQPSEGWGAGHRRLGAGPSGRLLAPENRDEDAGKSAERDTAIQVSPIRTIRIFDRGGVQSGTVYRTGGSWTQATRAEDVEEGEN